MEKGPTKKYFIVNHVKDAGKWSFISRAKSTHQRNAIRSGTYQTSRVMGNHERFVNNAKGETMFIFQIAEWVGQLFIVSISMLIISVSLFVLMMVIMPIKDGVDRLINRL